MEIYSASWLGFNLGFPRAFTEIETPESWKIQNKSGEVRKQSERSQ